MNNQNLNLKSEELEEITIFESYSFGVISATNAANNLQCSKRTFYRKFKKYKIQGTAMYVKEKVTRTKKFDSEYIVKLFKENYYDFNISHFKDVLLDEYKINISYATLHRILFQKSILSPYYQKRTLKKLKKAAQETLNPLKSSEQPTSNFNLIVEQKPSNRLPKITKAGFLVQIDASSATFFSNRTTNLHLAIDVCTGDIVGGFLDEQETIYGYFNVLKQILVNYGRPLHILTDNRSCFCSTKMEDKRIRQNSHVHIAYALKYLNIELSTTSVPTEKSIIERANGTFQRRLCAEMRLRKIQTLDEANKYLIEEFIPNMNKKFGGRKYIEYLYHDKLSVEEANKSLSFVYERRFDNAGTVSFKGKKYYPALYKEGKLKVVRNIKFKTECLFVQTLDMKEYISIDGTSFNAITIDQLPVDEVHLASPKEYILDRNNLATTSQIKEEFEKPKYTPWRDNMHKLFQKRYKS